MKVHVSLRLKMLHKGNKLQGFRKILPQISGAFAKAIMVIAVLLQFSCDVCDTGNGGSGQEPAIFFTGFSENSQFPGVFSVEEDGAKLEEVVSNAVIFSGPSINGKIAFRKQDTSTGMRTLYLSNTDGTMESVMFTEDASFSIAYPVLSFNGGLIAFDGGNGRLLLKSTATQGILVSITGNLLPNSIASFSPDSRMLAYFEGKSKSDEVSVVIWDAGSETEAYREEFEFGPDYRSGEPKICWIDNQTFLFLMTGAESDYFYIRDLSGRREEHRFRRNEVSFGGAYLPAANFNSEITFTGYDGNIWEMSFIESSLTFKKITNSPEGELNLFASYSAGGNKLVFSRYYEGEAKASLFMHNKEKGETRILANNADRGFWNPEN